MNILRWREIAALILLGLLIAGCAARNDNGRSERPGGFYGGVDGGVTRSGSDM